MLSPLESRFDYFISDPHPRAKREFLYLPANMNKIVYLEEEEEERERTLAFLNKVIKSAYRHFFAPK